MSSYVKGMDPMAAAFNGAKYSAVVDLSTYRTVEFVVYRGAGALGTAQLSLEACSDQAATEVAPMDCWYVRVAPDGTQSAPTPASVVATEASGSDIYVLKIDDQSVARHGWTHARLKSVEQTVDPVAGAVLVRLDQGRY
jgi:hypothetical protein